MDISRWTAPRGFSNNIIVIPPYLNMFRAWRRICHWSWIKTKLTPPGNNNLNFQCAHDQVVHVDACQPGIKQIIFCSFLLLILEV